MSLKKKLGTFFGIFSLAFFILITSPNFTFAQNEVTPLTSCTTTLEEGCYTLLEPLGGIEGVQVGNANGEGGIGGFMNFLFGIGIGVAGVLGVVMLIIYGFQYASNEQSIRGFTELKEKITSVILGLLLLLGTFILLRTINPDLLLVDPEMKGVSLEFDNITPISDETYKAITGTFKPSSQEIDKISIEMATKNNIDACIVRVLTAHESGPYGALAIGHDENVKSSGIPSRVNFINSGKTHKGIIFSKRIEDKFINDDIPINTNTDGLGLDWRFSHGIGLMQVTFFPTNNGLSPVREGITPKEVFSTEKNIETGIKIFKTQSDGNYCNNNLEKAFRAYNGGNCNSNNKNAVRYGRERLSEYNACKGL